MNSASKVGEIFTKAGETFHKLADMTVMLDPNAKELLVGGAKVRFRISDLYIVNFMSKIFGAKLIRSWKYFMISFKYVHKIYPCLWLWF